MGHSIGNPNTKNEGIRMLEFRDMDGKVEKMPKIAKKWSEKSTCGPSR
jgi:hypothetical protein